MRIIAGKHKSRVLKTLEGLNTRPMMDRMKESIFNCIGPYFEGGVTLDLFGGSGALTLEALSRGTQKGYIVEKAYDAIKVIKDNVSSLKEENNIVILNTDYKVALDKFKKDETSFDIIFLDPPYRMKIIEEIIQFILDNNLLKQNGIIICQYVKGNYVSKETQILSIRKNYSYASSEVCIYERK